MDTFVLILVVFSSEQDGLKTELNLNLNLVSTVLDYITLKVCFCFRV